MTERSREGTTGGAEVPIVRSSRRPWSALPAAARAGVAEMLGAPVVWTRTQSGGFSRGVATRLRCADGTRAFVKGVSHDGDPYAVRLYEQESTVVAALPAGMPAPAFRGRIDTGGWTLLLFDDVPGRPPRVPWRRGDVRTVISAMIDLTVRATPCPLPDAQPWGGELAAWKGWNHLLDTADPLPDAPPWAHRQVRRLAELEAMFPAAVNGDTLLHSDLRSDNIVLRQGTVTFVDWAWAAVGEPWVDPLIFALCAAVQGFTDPQSAFHSHPAGRAADPTAVDSVLAALAGRFLTAAREPADWDTGPVRAFQRAEAASALSWLAERIGAR